MFEILKAGGFLMYPILACSVLALAIVLERFWTLRLDKISPRPVVNELWRWIKKKELSAAKLRQLQESSPIGRILSAGLMNAKHGRDVMKESIEEEAAHVVHDLGRFLTLLGSIAAITPLLGLLGTVFGMIEVFSEIKFGNIGNAENLAGGISVALYTTAFGLTVAIPALLAHRHFLRRVDEIVVAMEQEAIKLVEVVHGDREIEVAGD